MVPHQPSGEGKRELEESAALLPGAVLFPTVVQFPRVKGTPGRPKERPDELLADAGYDSEVSRWILRWMGIEPKIRYKDGEHGSGLGKVRWVVERTIAWIKGPRRMRVRYDRSGIIRDAWAPMAIGVVCFNILTRILALRNGFGRGS